MTRRREDLTGLEVADPGDLGFTLGGWEIFQHAPFLEIFARHHRASVVRHQGLLLIARRVRGIGMLRAQVLSPEAAGADEWSRCLDGLPVGQIEVITNRRATSASLRPTPPADMYSMVIDLRDGSEALLARFEPRARKAIRRGRAGGLRVLVAEDRVDVSRFHALLEHVSGQGRRYGVPALPLLTDLLESGHGRLYMALHRDRLVGGVFVLAHRYAHGLVSGFAPEQCGGLPGNVLYWETLVGEMARGMPFFDLGTQSLTVNPGITLAKRSYSPVLVPAFRYEIRPSPWRGALNATFQSLRQIAGR